MKKEELAKVALPVIVGGGVGYVASTFIFKGNVKAQIISAIVVGVAAAYFSKKEFKKYE